MRPLFNNMRLEIVQKEREQSIKLVRITKESEIPLIGNIFIGIIDRGTNLLQVRATTFCNMNCTFCSTDAGKNSKWHKMNYIVDINYLAEEVEKIAKIKEDGLIIFLDSVGEPMSHPDFAELVGKLKKIKEVREVIVITNGTFLTKKKIDELIEAGLDKINLSLHAFDSSLAKELFGMQSYDVNKILFAIDYIKNKIDLMLTPVYLPGVNDDEIVKIIKFAKEKNIKIGLQKYETYKYSRKMKKAKKQTYWKFYDKILKWEKEFDIKLRVNDKDFGVEKRERIPEIFRIGDKINVEIVCPGWLPEQMIGQAEGRCISVNKCYREIGEQARIKIIENKNSIYLAELI